MPRYLRVVARTACILIADAVSAACDEVLRRAGIEVERNEAIAEADLPAALAPFDAVVVRSRIRVTAEAIAAAPRLRAIARAGAGTDNIDTAAARARGIAVLTAPGANARSVAEHVFALLFAIARRVADARDAMRAGRWDRGKFMGFELGGRTIGIVGAGRTGREVARIARGLGMRVMANSPSAMRDPRRRAELDAEGIELVDFPDLLAAADVLTLHVPLNDATRGLIGREALARMKPGAILINTSRGAVLDDGAVVEALQRGRLAAAGIDVYVQEPPPADHPYRRLPNVVCTPHLAASTHEAQERAAREVAERLVAFFAQPPEA